MSAPTAPAAARLLTREHLPLVTGIIALVTLGAFENRALMSILPTVVRELGGWSLFGAANGAPLATLAVAMAYAGGWTDRVGPRRVLFSGIVLFVAAQAACGLAPTMWVFVLGRGASGIAEAFLDTALTLLIARVLPEELRAKVFASFAAAWVLPSLLGPALAGAIDAVAGWRAVFVAPLVVVPIALVLMRRALGATDADVGTEEEAIDVRRLRASVALGAGLVATTFAVRSSPIRSTGWPAELSWRPASSCCSPPPARCCPRGRRDSTVASPRSSA